MISPLAALGVSTPILAAPMAGGPTTPALVTAAARANGLGFLAGGYRTADALAEQIAKVRSDGVGFGVNLFAPNPVPVEPEAFRRYARAVAPEARPTASTSIQPESSRTTTTGRTRFICY